jgi:CRISPR-associated protein Csm3
MSQLIGKVIIRSDIHCITGLRIGGSSSGIKVGGVDLNVITDPKGKPYLPGSSIRGKLRTLCERKEHVVLNRPFKENEKHSHGCEDSKSYKNCPICKIWGILGGNITDVPTLTRLQVSDVYLDETSIDENMKKNLELEWTEVKFETAINRQTGTALRGSLRQSERVPAGAVFSDFDMIFNIYEESDKNLLSHLFESMEILEDDYLGGTGSRGYGRVKFENIRIFWNNIQAYKTGATELTDNRMLNAEWKEPAQLVSNFESIKSKLK